MRGAILAVAAMAAPGLAQPAAAQDGWSGVEGGKRHDATGVVCPLQVAGFALEDAEGGTAPFNCEYVLDCTSQGCAGAPGFASLTWGSAADQDAEFRAMAEGMGMAVVEQPREPGGAGAPRRLARQGEGQERSYLAWWRIQAKGAPIEVAVFYTAATEPAARQFVEAVALANR